MTDDIPELPQFSRDVAVLSGRLPDSERGTDVPTLGVLDPFSGVLDVTLERGWVPMPDLSYLALEPLVASGLARRTGDDSGTRSASTAPDDARSESRDGDSDEPTVREVIHGDRDARPEQRIPDLRRLALEDEGPPRTRVDLGPERREHWADLSSGPSPDAPGDADSSFDVPDLATGEDSGRPERDARRGPGDDDRSNRTSTESTAFAPDQTVVQRSGSPFEETDRIGDASPSPSDPGSAGSEDVVAPRMVTDRTDGDAEPSLDQSSRRGRERSASSRRGGERSAERGPDGSGAEANGPRMVVERTEDESDGSVAGSDETSATSSGDGDAIGRDLSDRTVGGDEQLAEVVAASTDPESQLVDRLYRALQEREAIEQRRRIGR